MLDVGSRLDKSVGLVAEACTSEEFFEYRKAVAEIMGDILLNILNPIYKQHPGLRPPGLDHDVESD